MKEEIQRIRREYESRDRRVKNLKRDSENGYFEGSLEGARKIHDFYENLEERMYQFEDEFKDELKNLQKEIEEAYKVVTYWQQACSKARLAENRWRLGSMRRF